MIVILHRIGYLPFQLTSPFSHLVLITASIGGIISFVFYRLVGPLYCPDLIVSTISSSYFPNSS